MKRILIGLIIVACAPLLSSFAGPAQRSVEAGSLNAIDSPGHRWMGVESCRPCHSEGIDHERISLTEHTIWKGKDKHSQAYAVLENDRSKRMGELLGFEPTTSAACLSCHAVSGPNSAMVSSGVRHEDGVSCEACHGPASGWGLEHTVPDWAQRDWSDKEALGMINVFDAPGRAKQCVSCHVGNVAEGKLLPHSFYAAGHPPLPGIEIDTFSQAMPPHWKPREGDDALAHRGQMIFAGALATLAASMAYVAESADDGPESTWRHWPDYASFDCASCHHDIRLDSWRRERGYDGGVAGRPLPRTWVTPLAQVAAALLGGNAPRDLASHQASLRGAFDSRPFGEPKQVASAAGNLASWARDAAETLASRGFTRRVAQRALRMLCGAENAEHLDYDAARQVAWAIKSLVELLDISRNGDEIAAVLTQLEGTLRLTLPAGTDVSILDQLPGALKSVAGYEDVEAGEAGSARFAKHLASLANLLE